MFEANWKKTRTQVLMSSYECTAALDVSSNHSLRRVIVISSVILLEFKPKRVTASRRFVPNIQSEVNIHFSSMVRMTKLPPSKLIPFKKFTA